MKVVGVQKANLKECVREAQRSRAILTRTGEPVALLVGVSQLD